MWLRKGRHRTAQWIDQEDGAGVRHQVLPGCGFRFDDIARAQLLRQPIDLQLVGGGGDKVPD